MRDLGRCHDGVLGWENKVPMGRNGHSDVKLCTHVRSTSIALRNGVELLGKGVAGERTSRSSPGSEIGDSMDELPWGVRCGKTSNVNVNFGDPGLVDRDRMAIWE